MKMEENILNLSHATLGAERRQMIAHGVSRGYRVVKFLSPEGAAE
jgi:hypothetical protein